MADWSNATTCTVWSICTCSKEVISELQTQFILLCSEISAPQVTLKSAVTEVYEGNALANFTVVRSGDTQSNVTVFFGTRQLSSEDAAVGESTVRDMKGCKHNSRIWKIGLKIGL